MSLFLCFSGISLVRYCQKSLARSGGFREKIIEGGGGGGGGGGGWPYKGLSIEEGDSNLLYTMLASLARSSLQILEESYDRGISNFQISGQIPSKQKLP